MKKSFIIATVLVMAIAFAVPALAWASPQEMLDHKAVVLAQRVEEGVITSEQAETILKAINERIENCAGSPTENRERFGQTLGKGLGFGRTGGKGTGHMARGGNR